MKAAIHKKYSPPGPIIIEEVTKPVPGSNEVLIKVVAATFNRTDCANVGAKPWFMRFATGILKPKKPISGTDFAGMIESVGDGVKKFKAGESVFGFDDGGLHSHAEYMTLSADNALATIPNGINFGQAAASIEGAHYAYNFINKVDLQKGQQVMVHGASGAIGSAMVQLVKYFGAEITATAATKNIELVQSLGAKSVIDYTKEDFTKTGEKFDYVFDSVGKSTFGKCKKILKKGGIYISSELGPFVQNVFLPTITKFTGSKRVIFPIPYDRQKSVFLVQKLMEEGVFKPVIDRTYPLAEIENAYEYVVSGKKTGNVIIKIADQ